MHIDEMAALVEQVSVRYGELFGIERSDEWLMLKLQEEVGELSQAFLALTGQARDKGASEEEVQAQFRAEVADVLGMAMLVGRRFGLDLDAEMKAKWLVHLPS
ncbi:pyrophosphatase [Nesterenkonia salmonea]|uniref:Pyrophosphatase n=1 Tax=Nesterenkonia salmonea TaxID=1804987 RepID=A0A5R9BAI6_9MICC|nr:pyrophosphatase [Nesterenkonia salmonea]TLP97011.1 pyrophosphatase [Nesterenkonia salmonea]